jgi:hypothetical protein
VRELLELEAIGPIVEALGASVEALGAYAITANEVLAIPGLTKTSREAIESYFSEREPDAATD